MVLQAVRTANQRVVPGGAAPIKQDPGRFMVEQVKRIMPERALQQVPPQAEAAVAKLLPLGYGMALAALYAAARRETQRSLVDGLCFGALAWAVGYLGWLPGARLMPPVWRHKPRQIIPPLTEHAIYGLATVLGYHWLKRRVRA